MDHPFHRQIGDLINNTVFSDYKIIKDPACGGEQYIPLFCSEERSRKTEYCNVDLLIIVDNKIKVIIEIEEANIKPTQICGKFLTSALSKYFIHESENNNLVRMADSVLFVQIVNTVKLKIDKTAKIEQWEHIKKSIQSIIPFKESSISQYEIFYGNKSNFDKKSLVDCILGFLKR
jgi:hypothetical protein